MRGSVTIASHKGGVGKTTTVLNLGFALARAGRQVLLVDGDPQGGLAHATQVGRRARGGLVQVLRGAIGLEEAITPTRADRLALLAAGAESPEDVRLLEDAARDGTLRHLVATIPPRWETTLIDSPAGTGALLHALLTASDAMLAVSTPKTLSVRGLPSLLFAFERAEAENPGLRFDGLLLTMLEAIRRSDWDVRAQLRRQLPAGALLRTAIPFDHAVEGASERGLPFALVERAERVAAAYAELAAELHARADPAARATEAAEGARGLF
jgi:chromosome partitioning protein